MAAEAVQCVQGVDWSTELVLQQTLEQAERLTVNCAPVQTLPTLQDIDTLQASRHQSSVNRHTCSTCNITL